MVKVKKGTPSELGTCNACSVADIQPMVVFEVFLLNSGNSGTSFRLCAQHANEMIGNMRDYGFRTTSKEPELTDEQADCEHLSTYVENTRREYCSDCDMLIAELD